MLHKIFQVLVSDSKFLKISLREREMLQTILKQCMEWEQNACSLLNVAVSLLNTDVMPCGISGSLVSKIESQLLLLKSITQAGLCLKFEFAAMPKLQDACSTLQWCSKALSFWNVIPTLQVCDTLNVNGEKKFVYVNSMFFLAGAKW